MKLYTVCKDGGEAVMVQPKGSEKLYPLSAFGVEDLSMQQLIGSFDSLCGKLEAAPAGEGFDLAEVSLLAPIPHPAHDVLCLGLNYANHREEAARFQKEAFQLEKTYPVYFSKRVNEALRPGGKICSYPDLVDSLDYEVELGVIIGKDAFQVPAENAYDYVFGYTIVNDVSARNLQTRHKQWYLGKSLDTFTPMGPCIVTKDEFDIPPVVHLKSVVNGEVRQDGTTDMLIFDLTDIISDATRGMTLEAGTIIATGTPAGVGMGFNPPRFLKHGDVVRCEADGIGVLENIID